MSWDEDKNPKDYGWVKDEIKVTTTVTKIKDNDSDEIKVTTTVTGRN